jgi:exonuclease III
MISQKNAAIRHYRSHKDPRGLGRWVEQTFKGKGTHFLTVICGYCPNRLKTAQPYTVFRQHCDRFNQLRVNGNEENLTEPRQQMLNDLEERIRELKRENHEIILMADWNEDICGRKISNFINKLELKEAILS